MHAYQSVGQEKERVGKEDKLSYLERRGEAKEERGRERICFVK